MLLDNGRLTRTPTLTRGSLYKMNCSTRERNSGRKRERKIRAGDSCHISEQDSNVSSVAAKRARALRRRPSYLAPHTEWAFQAVCPVTWTTSSFFSPFLFLFALAVSRTSRTHVWSSLHRPRARAPREGAHEQEHQAQTRKMGKKGGGKLQRRT